MDTVNEFIKDHCKLSVSSDQYEIAKLRIHYQIWCEFRGYKAMNVRNFRQDLNRLGYEIHQNTYGRHSVYGIRPDMEIIATSLHEYKQETRQQFESKFGFSDKKYDRFARA